MKLIERDAEQGLDYLRNTSDMILKLEEQARLKSHMLKHIEGKMMLIGTYKDVPVSIRREMVRGSDKWMEIATEEAIAHAELASLREKRDEARIKISLYQSWTRDRRG